MIARWLLREDRTGHILWLGMALVFGLYDSAFGLMEAFQASYVIQDDARQHVFWMQRFVDPTLFPNDPIADYFQSVAPLGFTWLYRALSVFGLDPVSASRLLPLPITLLYAAAAYAVGVAITRAPLAGFLVAWVAVQNVWLLEDIASATPRALLYPLFMGFLALAMFRRVYLAAGAVLLLGLFYPAYAMVAGGVAALMAIQWRDGHPALAADRRELGMAVLCVVASICALALYALHAGAYGPVISYAEARQLPEFWNDGRSSFFDLDSIRFWSCGIRSGLLPPEWCQLRGIYWGNIPGTVVTLPLLLGVLALPYRFRDRFDSSVFILPRVIAVGVGLFVLAHILLFDLHLPARYTHHSFRMVFDISLGVLLYLATVKAISAFKSQTSNRPNAASSGLLALSAFIVLFPLIVDAHGHRNYKVGKIERIYEFLSQAPKNATVVSLDGQADNIPAFAQRSVIGVREYGIPYHLGYYRPYRQRVELVAWGQYTGDPAVFADVLDRLAPTYWLISNESFDTATIADSWWSPQFPDLAALQDDARPVLAELAESCEAVRDGAYRLLDAACLRDRLDPR